MADIAAIFHWPLSELLALKIDDLFNWRELAIARWNRMYAEKDEG